MLTREHAIADYDFQNGRVVPDRLARKTHAPYLEYAARMLIVYRTGAGRARRDLHRDIEAIFAAEADCPVRRIQAFCKLLDDVSEYEQDLRGQAAALRSEVFRRAAARHPLVREADTLFEHEEARVKTEIAAELARPWKEIDEALFADLIDFQRLVRFDGYADAAALLARYNVAQAQAVLFDASSLTVWAEEDFKTILRYAKLARLMHTIQRTGPGSYRIHFDGPASVLRETRRYGAAMACFLPALIACRNWRLHAVLSTRRKAWHLSYQLSSGEGLTSHLPAPQEFDSHVEEAFATKWGPEPREGWQLVREGEILERGQKVFVPDFVFRHEDGRTVLMEIVGFWTPEYLQAKRQTLKAFEGSEILLAVAASAVQQLPELGVDAIPFKSVLRVKDVLARLG